MTDEPLKVGDEVAIIPRTGGLTILKITRVSKTGRLTLNDGTVLNPDMTIRGAAAWGPYCANRVNLDMRNVVEQSNHLMRLKAIGLHDLTLDQLRRIVAIVEE